MDDRLTSEVESSYRSTTIECPNQYNSSQEPLLLPTSQNEVEESVSSENTEGRQGVRCYNGLRFCSFFSLVISLLAAVLSGTFPLIFHTLMNYELSLQPGTNAYKMWMNSPVPMYMKFYMFNITNVEEVLQHKAKPVLQELGPYVFGEWHQRVKIEHYDNHTMKFQQVRTWQFVPELSNGSLTDSITSLNVPLMAAANALRDYPFLIKFSFDRAVKLFGSTRYITKSVDELLFQGYDDKLLNFSSKLPPGLFPTPDKFGWFYGRNGSEYYDGVFNIFSGARDISRMGEMDLWNSTRQNKFFDSYCGQVNGSFGEAFPPRRQKTNITFYSTDLCRSLLLDYKEEVDHYGVTANRYYGSWKVFDNGTLYPDNWCYCVKGQCHPSGVVDSSTCRSGAPAFVSFPHFLYGDPFYLEQVDGLNPQENQHQFHIDLEPETGIPVTVAARLQINILMEEIPDVRVTENITRTYLPMFWFTMEVNVDDKLASSIKLLNNVPFIGTTTCFTLFCASLFCASICSIALKRRSRKVHISS